MTTISVNVSETLEVGTTIVSTEQPSLNIFHALDRDRGEHGRIRYSFSRLNQDSNHPIILPFLQLNPSTGALVVIQSLDIDSNLPLTVSDFALDVIRVTVCDRENDRDDDQCPNLAVQIRVDSINEFNPRFSKKVYHTSIPESTDVGAHIIEVNCTDQDIGRGRFQGIMLDEKYGQSRNSSFALESNIIRLIRPLDFEESQFYNITLICCDNDGKHDTALLIINITAINEEQPHFTQNNYSFTVNRISKVGTEIGQVKATDNDQGIGGDVSYTLQGESENFGIRSEGVIYLAGDIFALSYSFLTLVRLRN